MKTKPAILALHFAIISTGMLATTWLISPALSAPRPKASVTVTVEGAGTITSNPAGIICPTDCTQQYKRNTVVTFTAINGGNYSFSGWGGACTGIDPTCTVQLTGPTSITAQFTPPAQYPAPVPATGQTKCYTSSSSSGTEIYCAGTGQDGDIQAGVAWPLPRFTDNNDGTVTDNLTGIIWLKNANCWGKINMDTALLNASLLAHGSCDLTDNSTAGQWRLANVRELLSLIDYEYSNPALSNTPGDGKWTEGYPFTGVRFIYDEYYLPSTTYVLWPDSVPAVYFDNGFVSRQGKGSGYAWPVRGGQ